VFKIGWKEGNATIVARQTHEGQYRRGINSYAPTGLYHHVYDYVADVTPDDGSPMFRARFVEMFESDEERRPLVSQEARVKFNPKNQETAFDRDVLWKEAQPKSGSAAGRLFEGPVGSEALDRLHIDDHRHTGAVGVLIALALDHVAIDRLVGLRFHVGKTMEGEEHRARAVGTAVVENRDLRIGRDRGDYPALGLARPERELGRSVDLEAAPKGDRGVAIVADVAEDRGFAA
jgi:hypothetical protein